jgi:hypothetical protein
MLFVLKKDGAMRVCVDYRKLNDPTRKDRTPLPRIDELLDSLHGARYFSTLDMYKGYHQVRVKERDIYQAAFRTHYGLFEYCVIPFELCNAPARFQAIMNRVFDPYLGKLNVVYMDDVLIYNKTADEHLEHIRLELRELRRHQLHIKPSNSRNVTSDDRASTSSDMWKLDGSEWTPKKWRQYRIDPAEICDRSTKIFGTCWMLPEVYEPIRNPSNPIDGHDQEDTEISLDSSNSFRIRAKPRPVGTPVRWERTVHREGRAAV